jgi:hypothetical protein
MQAIPAGVAGVGERVVVTPPAKDGSVHPAMILAAAEAGLDAIWLLGGAQAIAALTYGAVLEDGEIPACDKLFGPGNAYVAEAKKQATALPGGPAVDMPAGPSELMVVVDRDAAPEIAAADPAPMDLEEFEGLPKDLADKIKGAIAGNLGGLGLPLGADDAQVAPRMEEALRELKERMQGAMGQALLVPDAADANAKIQGASTIRMKDAQGSVELKSTDGAKEVTLRDEEDNVTWNGPWDTAQDKQAAPEDVRKRVDSLNIDHSFKGAGLRLQMGRAGALGE